MSRDQTHRQGLSKDPSEEGTALEQGVLHVVHRRDLLHRLAQLVSLFRGPGAPLVLLLMENILPVDN